LATLGRLHGNFVRLGSQLTVNGPNQHVRFALVIRQPAFRFTRRMSATTILVHRVNAEVIWGASLSAKK
jgi:hypothetical protein